MTPLEFRGDIETLSLMAIVWRCLRDPMFSRFDTLSGVTDTHTDSQRETDSHTDDDGVYRANIASCGKAEMLLKCLERPQTRIFAGGMTYYVVLSTSLPVCVYYGKIILR